MPWFRDEIKILVKERRDAKTVLLGKVLQWHEGSPLSWTMEFSSKKKQIIKDVQINAITLETWMSDSESLYKPIA